MNAPSRLPPGPERLRLTVDHFLLLSEGGAFADHAKTELIDGDIYVMNAQYHPHARAKTQLTYALISRLKEMGSSLEAVVEVSVRLSEGSMPEPDIALTGWRGKGAVPAETVALVIEVSDTTLAFDLGRKAELYAAAGIPEYWVVDLDGGRVLIHDRPDAGGYRGRREVAFGAPLAAATIAGLVVDGAVLVG